MGASDSKLVFKQGIFKLSEKSIASNDLFWESFWQLPESAEDVFSLFTPADIRRIRDDSRQNLETLILAVCDKLQRLRHHPHFPSQETQTDRHALNCIRVLTRLLPFVYEAEHLEQWEDNFFWEPRDAPVKTQRSEVLFDGANEVDTKQDDEATTEPAKPLGEGLIDTLMDLLYFADFTIPALQTPGDKVKLAIWQSGVGCNNPVGSSKELESNRLEILRLLLTLASRSMYTTPGLLPVQGVRALTYLTSTGNKTLVLTTLCSLLNTTLKYNPAAWRVPYDHVVLRDPKQVFVTYCLQLLLVLVLYPVPEGQTSVPPRNAYRHFLGKLHRPQDFQFLVDGMTRILNQPLSATSSYLPGSFKSLAWAPEMVMLFWEVLQCNRRFRSFIVDTDRAHDFLVLILFYALEHRNDASKQGIVRMCIFVLQTLSVEPTFGSRLNKPFRGQETLPQVIRVPNFSGTYADFLIISVNTLITTTHKVRLEAIYPALLAILNNIAPHAVGLGSTASSKLMQLFALMSKPDFLFANESNHALLKSLLEVFNAILEHQYDGNATFVYTILRSQRRFQSLRELVLTGAEDALSKHAQIRKESLNRSSLDNSADSLRRPSHPLSPTTPSSLDDTFTIGDEDDEDDEDAADNHSTNNTSSTPQRTSRASSIHESIEDAVPSQMGPMSEKARGKLPAGGSKFSRHGSTASLASLALGLTIPNAHFEPSAAWASTWLHELPMHTPLTLIEYLTPQVPSLDKTSPTSVIDLIRSIQSPELEGAPVRIHLFEWTPLSLGWYESLLWGLIFASEMDASKGVPSVWKGTNVRLFRVQETAAQGPSLMSPRGAVDAVGRNLVERVGNLNLGAANGSPSAGRSSGPGNIRDV